VEADRSGLEQRLQAVQVVLHNQDNREHDLLDSDDYYQFQGGLSAAVEAVRGSAPQLWFGDHSRQQRPRLHRLERELDKVLRSRVLNPRWIRGMQQHGYKGGFEMAASLDYLFAYDASTGRVPDWSYGAITEQWLKDPEVLAFLQRSNPWALRDMAERLLEAHHRGLWDGAKAEELAHLRQILLQAEALVASAADVLRPALEGVDVAGLAGGWVAELGLGLTGCGVLLLLLDGGRTTGHVDANGGALHALIELSLADLLGEGLLDRLGHTAGEVDLSLLAGCTAEARGGFLQAGFHRGDLGHHLLVAGAVGGTGEGAADGVGAAHELHVAHGAGGVGVQEEGFLFRGGLGRGGAGDRLRTTEETIEKTHREAAVNLRKP
jgi:hypothetical protein